MVPQNDAWAELLENVLDFLAVATGTKRPADICSVRTEAECRPPLQFKYVLELFDKNLDFINKTPCFWKSVITSLKYSILMQTARLFDESKDAVGIRKILNRVEQSKYRDVAKEVLDQVWKEYDGYLNLIEDIRNMRDKIYAHNDKILYRDWNIGKLPVGAREHRNTEIDTMENRRNAWK